MSGTRSSKAVFLLLAALLAPAFACASTALTGAGSSGAGSGTANVSYVHSSSVGTNGSTGVTSLAAGALTVTAGDTLCASVLMYQAQAGSVTGVSDDLSHAFTKEAEAGPGSIPNNQEYVYIWCYFNETAGSRTITATFNSANCQSSSCTNDTIWVVEFTKGAGVLDGTPTGLYIGTTSNPAIGTSITTSNSGSMMYVLGASALNVSAYSGFTAATSTGNATLGDYYQSLGAPGSYSPRVALSAGTDYADVLAVALH